jgi:hypothetical protein
MSRLKLVKAKARKGKAKCKRSRKTKIKAKNCVRSVAYPQHARKFNRHNITRIILLPPSTTIPINPQGDRQNEENKPAKRRLLFCPLPTPHALVRDRPPS